MKYLDEKFSVHPGGNKAYRDNYDKIFGKKNKDDGYSVSELPAPREVQAPTDADLEKFRQIVEIAQQDKDFKIKEVKSSEKTKKKNKK